MRSASVESDYYDLHHCNQTMDSCHSNQCEDSHHDQSKDSRYSNQSHGSHSGNPYSSHSNQMKDVLYNNHPASQSNSQAKCLDTTDQSRQLKRLDHDDHPKVVPYSDQTKPYSSEVTKVYTLVSCFVFTFLF